MADDSQTPAHDPRDHALHHLWKASKYYGAVEGIKEIARIDSYKDKVPHAAERATMLQAIASLLDSSVEFELRQAYRELQIYFGDLPIEQQEHADLVPPKEEGDVKTPTVRDRVVAVAARFTDEVFGYDRWKADQVGPGDRPGALILFDSEIERDDFVRNFEKESSI